MPKGIPLNNFQKGQAIAFRKQGKSIREISKLLNISKTAISNYLRNPSQHGIKKKTGRPKILTPRDERNIIRELKKKGSTISKVQMQAGLTHVSRQTVYNYIKRSQVFIYKKRQHHPKWTEMHVANRLSWARDHMSWTTEWTSVIFSDEKRFNLDGPDGYQFYWHCIKNEDELYSTRQMGGGSLMVWLAVGYGGRTSLVFLNGRQNHKDYIRLLESELLPYGTELGGEDWIFQQDGAAIHTANGVKHWFRRNKVRVLPWPAKSPDLNIVENIWATLVHRVYSGGKQYESVVELRNRLNYVWDNFCQSEIQALYDSMPNRVFEVIKANGKKTSY